MSARARILPPETTRRCEATNLATGRQCSSTAAGFVVFETTTREGIKTILPFEWRCIRHSELRLILGKERWVELSRKFQTDFARRLGYEPQHIIAGLSTLTEHEVSQLRQFAQEFPIAGPRPDLDVEVVDMRDIPEGWESVKKVSPNE